MDELGAISELAGRAGNYAHLRFAADTDDPANGALVAARQGARDGDRDAAAVLRARVGGARRRARRASCSPPTASTTARHYLRTVRRYRPHLLTEPEEKLLAEKSVTGTRRLVAPLQRADRRAARRDPRRGRAAHARRRAEPPALPRPRRAPHRRRGASPRRSSPACARAPTSSTRCSRTRRPTTACARYPTWLSSRNLSNEASDESVQALLERRRAGLRAAAPLVPPQGAAARPRAARRLRPRGVGRRRTTSEIDWDDGRELVLDAYADFSPQLGDLVRARSSTSAGSTPRRGRASAAARSAPTPSPASTRTCC